MKLRLPVEMQVLASRLGLALSPLFAGPAKISQLATYRDGFAVPQYKSIREITAATSRLSWTPDPWDGKLDIIKHPTFMQQAIEQHPNYSGDCDDFAAYWAVALRKSGLADDVWFASGLWVDQKKHEITGHAICVYRIGDDCFHVSNWGNCVPFAIKSSTSWVEDMERRAGVQIFAAVMYSARAARDDTMLLGKPIVVRR